MLPLAQGTEKNLLQLLWHCNEKFMFSILHYFQNPDCTLDSKIERVRLSKKELIYFSIIMKLSWIAILLSTSKQ